MGSHEELESHGDPVVAISPIQQSCLLLLFALLMVAPIAGAQERTQFDVPIIVEACEVTDPFFVPMQSNERLVEVVIPVSTWVSDRGRDEVQSFRFEIQWSQSPFPLVDYFPKTTMQSDVEGLIAIEKQTETTLTGKVDAAASIASVTASVLGQGSRRDLTKKNYSEVPRHELLVASGTVQRGTGAFYRFYDSRKFSLEGGRDLVVLYRVSPSWRGGVLRVVCEAERSRKILGTFDDSSVESRAFMVPIYLQADPASRDMAIQYSQSEQQLRQAWDSFMKSRNQTTMFDPFHVAKRSSSDRLDDEWVHSFIQTSMQKPSSPQLSQLPATLREAINEFEGSRSHLIAISK